MSETMPSAARSSARARAIRGLGRSLEIDVDAGMRDQKRRQHVGQEVVERGGIGQQPHPCLHPGRVLVELAVHALGLLEHEPGVMEQGAAGGRGGDAPPAAREQARAEAVLHAAQARAGRSQRQMRTRRAAGDRSGVEHVYEQLQVDQIETH